MFFCNKFDYFFIKNPKSDLFAVKVFLNRVAVLIPIDCRFNDFFKTFTCVGQDCHLHESETKLTKAYMSEIIIVKNLVAECKTLL